MGKDFYTMKSNKNYFVLYEVINNTLEICRNSASKISNFRFQITNTKSNLTFSCSSAELGSYAFKEL